MSLLIAALRLWVMFWVALDLAIVGWTFKDARRRIQDPVIVAVCVASAALFPFVGALIYVIVRPPEYLKVARERQLQIRVMERGLGVDRRTTATVPARQVPDAVLSPRSKLLRRIRARIPSSASGRSRTSSAN